MHCTFGIGLMHAGGHTSLSGRGRVTACAGDVITVNPAEVHDGSPYLGQPRRWQMLYFEPCVIEAVCATPGGMRIAPPELAFPVLRNAEAARLFERLFGLATHLTSNPSLDLHWEELLTRLINILAARAPARRAYRTEVLAVQARINADPSRNESLGELAAAVELSRFELVRLFTAAFGLPPHAYRVVRRTKWAADLIRQGTPLSQAAAQTGFSDQSHMNRAIKRLYGWTPGQLAQTSNLMRAQ
jgi:AraC-like DNA-binding protein